MTTLTASELKSLESFAAGASRSSLQKILKLLAATRPLVPTIPHKPWERQEAFLRVRHREALYGGAAGGGKSDGLLMAAAQYVHVPGYSALLLRRTFKQLKLANALLDRAHRFWGHIATWEASSYTFTFPGGGRVTFGYLENERDKDRYRGSEFQFIGFDELTDFRESQYLFLFSRLRKTRDLDVPLRMRAATNPGGEGHRWVKKRFISEEAAAAMLAGTYRNVYELDGRAFVPSKLEDNPAVDSEEYSLSLAQLPPVERARLRAGDWTIEDASQVDLGWFRYFTSSAVDYVLQDAPANVPGVVRHADCVRYTVVDCAATSADAQEQLKTGERSETAVVTFDYHRGQFGQSPAWLVVDARGGYWSFPEILDQVRSLASALRPARIGFEDEKTGRAAFETLFQESPSGAAVIALPTRGRDKLTRAADFLNRAYEHRVFFPESAYWMPPVFEQLRSWRGLPKERADYIDALAYGIREVESLAVAPSGRGSVPRMIGVPRW